MTIMVPFIFATDLFAMKTNYPNYEIPYVLINLRNIIAGNQIAL
jgi:hypothetical protein